MKRIQIDDDVYRYLQRQAIPFEEASPNDTLRRLFGLEQKQMDLFALQPEASLPPLRPFEPALQGNHVQENAGTPRVSSTLSAPRRRPKVSLRLLVAQGYLTEGQTLYLHDYDGSRIPGSDFEATLAGDRLLWSVDQQTYSLSALAILLLRKRGHRGEAVRGPARWFTADEISLQTMWDHFLKKRKSQGEP